MKALNYKIAPKAFRSFADDSHARFQERSHVDESSKTLDIQDSVIEYTSEFEDYKHSLKLSRH